MSLNDLPALNACLNAASATFLSCGYYSIKHQKKVRHRNCMIGALICSIIFLISYLTYHAKAGRTVFAEPQWFRPIYLFILLTHTILAVVIIPMIIVTVRRAAGRRWEMHKRISRYTFPLWMYVSITGVVIYLLLYQVFPQKTAGKQKTVLAERK